MSDEPTFRRRRRRRRFLFLLLVLLVAFGVRRTGLLLPSVSQGSYVFVELQGAYEEQAPDGLVGRFLGDRSLSLLELLLALRDAREDDRVAGVVVRIRGLGVGWAKAGEIRDALLTYRDAGKPVIAYLEQEVDGNTLEYYVASAAQTIYMPPAASAALSGLRSEAVFLGGVWENLDIDMQVEQIGAYKSMGDMLGGKSMTTPHREMANSLLDSLYALLVDGISAGRDLEPPAVRASIDAAPATVADYQAAGLVDGARFLRDIEADLLGADEEFMSLDDFREARRPPSARPQHKIAVVFGVGMVATGGDEGGGFDRQDGMRSDAMAHAFHQAAEDDGVQAIVFRVDSPGGSALASDLIWKATQEARARKPVIVSMSDVAGSGGYYVAAGATKIVAAAGTLTGSIGVVAAKPNLSGFLENLGVRTETLKRGEMADLTSVTSGLSQAERARVRQSMDHVYDLFVERVAAGRGMSSEEVDEIGRGRVWTGTQAFENGLVDRLGGLFTAIEVAKSEAGIPPDEKAELVFYPKQKSFFERVGNLLGARVVGTPPAIWDQVRSQMVPYRFPPGSILTLMPQQIRIR